MSIELADITVAIKTAIEVANETVDTFNQDIAVVDVRVPVSSASDLTNAKVSVVPASDEWSIESRKQMRRDIAIDVGVEKLIAATDVAGVSNAMQLVRQLASVLAMKKQAGAAFNGLTIEPVYDPERLRENGHFVSVIKLKYVVFED